MKRVLKATIFVALTGMLYMMFPSVQASAQTATATKPDVCNPGEIFCMPNAEIQVEGVDQCAGSNMSFLFGGGSNCVSTSNLDDNAIPTQQAANQTQLWPFNGIFIRLTELVQTDLQFLMNFILVDQMSGHNTSTNPVLVCSQAQGAQQIACAGKGEWFVGQYGLMRNVGLYVCIPLYLMMVIQSIIKGSLYNLLRHSLIMLPLAIVGTVIVIAFLQLLLNITDDTSNYIVNRSTVGLQVDSCTDSLGQTVTTTACGLKNSLVERSIGSSGLFPALLWMLVLMAASIAIYLELVGRQIGIYAVAVLMPLVMAGMVWSRSMAVAKKVFQYEIALIFSKLFIVAAMSLGLGAWAHTNSTQCYDTKTAPGQAPTPQACVSSANGATRPADARDQTSSDDGIQALAVGALIFLTAAFAGSKVVTLSPAAEAGKNMVWNKGIIASRGQAIAAAQKRILQFMYYRNRNRKAGTNFNNTGHSASTAAVASPPPPPPRPRVPVAPLPPPVAPPPPPPAGGRGGGGGP